MGTDSSIVVNFTFLIMDKRSNTSGEKKAHGKSAAKKRYASFGSTDSEPEDEVHVAIATSATSNGNLSWLCQLAVRGNT